MGRGILIFLLFFAIKVKNYTLFHPTNDFWGEKVYPKRCIYSSLSYFIIDMRISFSRYDASACCTFILVVVDATTLLSITGSGTVVSSGVVVSSGALVSAELVSEGLVTSGTVVSSLLSGVDVTSGASLSGEDVSSDVVSFEVVAVGDDVSPEDVAPSEAALPHAPSEQRIKAIVNNNISFFNMCDLL